MGVRMTLNPKCNSLFFLLEVMASHWVIFSPGKKKNDKSCILEKSLINIGRLDWNKEPSSTGRLWGWLIGDPGGKDRGKEDSTEPGS